jgi:hypothetical protein
MVKKAAATATAQRRTTAASAEEAIVHARSSAPTNKVAIAHLLRACVADLFIVLSAGLLELDWDPLQSIAATAAWGL